MPKKIMTVQLGDASEVSEIAETSKTSETKPAEPQILERKMEKLESDEPSGPLLSAEEVTRIAINFFKGLGNKYVMPKRVSKEGERNYGVEIDLKGKAASILIDRSTKEIIEYEITESRREREVSSGGGSSSFSIRTIVIVVAIQIVLMVAFNLLRFSNINIPFLTGPPAQ